MQAFDALRLWPAPQHAGHHRPASQGNITACCLRRCLGSDLQLGADPSTDNKELVKQPGQFNRVTGG